MWLQKIVALSAVYHTICWLADDLWHGVEYKVSYDNKILTLRNTGLKHKPEKCIVRAEAWKESFSWRWNSSYNRLHMTQSNQNRKRKNGSDTKSDTVMP